MIVKFYILGIINEKKITLLFSLLILLGTSVFEKTTYAAGIDAQEVTADNDVNQEEIDRRLEIVFVYLNEHASDADFNGQSSLTFNIPVDKGEIVTADIANQESSKARVFGYSTHSIVANTSYTYTLTLKNVIGSGDTTKYVVEYTVGNSTPNNNGTY